MDRQVIKLLVYNAVTNRDPLARCNNEAEATELANAVVQTMEGADGKFPYRDKWYRVVSTPKAGSIVLNLEEVPEEKKPVVQPIKENPAKPRPKKGRKKAVEKTPKPVKPTLEDYKAWWLNEINKRKLPEQKEEPKQPPPDIPDEEDEPLDMDDIG